MRGIRRWCVCVSLTCCRLLYLCTPGLVELLSLSLSLPVWARCAHTHTTRDPLTHNPTHSLAQLPTHKLHCCISSRSKANQKKLRCTAGGLKANPDVLRSGVFCRVALLFVRERRRLHTQRSLCAAPQQKPAGHKYWVKETKQKHSAHAAPFRIQAKPNGPPCETATADPVHLYVCFFADLHSERRHLLQAWTSVGQLLLFLGLSYFKSHP